MGKAQVEELRKNGKYFSVPRGISMKPLIKNKQGIVEIHELKTEAKRYDVVLYERKDDVGVIHRVLHVKYDHYIIAGDNCWTLEYIPKEAVVGIAVRYYRNGKWHEMDTVPYRIYSHVWADLFFIRRPVFFVRDKCKKALGKLKRKFKK